MAQTRSEHLAWCKRRALEIVATGDLPGAVASMISDLEKWDGGALYPSHVLAIASADGVLFCADDPARCRHWIEGFN